MLEYVSQLSATPNWTALPGILLTNSTQTVVDSTATNVAQLWVGIQADYDLEVARLRSESRIEKRVQPLAVLRPATT